MGIVWLRLFNILGEEKYHKAAEKMALAVAKTQFVGKYKLEFLPVSGAIAGSWPVWGSYVRLGYPNWAAKFFADLLMALEY